MVRRSLLAAGISFTPLQNEIHEVRIDRIVPNGFGIGFAEGLTFFVALAAPGDVLRVRATQTKGRTVFAEVVEILQPSAVRVAPACEHFGSCGGCDFQHLSYQAQLDAKRSIVRDCLKRIGKIEIEEIAIEASPAQFGYRSRAQWHADTRARKLGYFKRGSHDVIDVERCPVLTPELEAAMTALRSRLEWESIFPDRVKVEAANSAGSVSVFSDELLEPTHELDFCTSEDRYHYDARSFFQGNQLLIEKLIDLAVGGARGSLALDLYCGVGLFTLPLARRFERVVGVESGHRAVAAAKKNLRDSGLSNAEVYDAPAGEWLRANAALFTEPDLLLLDPPRSGTERETIGLITKLRPKAISYVSCEPSTLARDLRVLIDHGYAIDSVTAVDLFPQTHHVETVVRLT